MTAKIRARIQRYVDGKLNHREKLDLLEKCVVQHVLGSKSGPSSDLYPFVLAHFKLNKGYRRTPEEVAHKIIETLEDITELIAVPVLAEHERVPVSFDRMNENQNRYLTAMMSRNTIVTTLCKVFILESAEYRIQLRERC